MKRKRTLLALLSSVPLYVLGCGEDVGDCQDANEGRDPVLSGTQVQFGGQAIINKACASCHGSKSKGDTRVGAPAGLDFDLFPVESGDVGENKDGDAYVKLKASDVNGLRERQRKVFEERNNIWQQVKDGLMPPSGVGEAFRILKTIFKTNADTPCTAGKAYAAISEKSSQDVLRNWLACGAPIVESNNATVTETKGVSGAAGYQYPSCGSSVGGDAGVGDGGVAVVTIETVQTNIFDAYCTVCHAPEGVYDSLDLSTAEKSYAALVQDTAGKCDGKPFVKKMDPAGSFLYDKVAKDDPGCDGDRMPPTGMDLSASELKLISDWINGGALRASDVKSKSLGPIGVDAGTP